ncbi:MAG: UxaA family hydrolase [Chloroflexota bacterium]
MNENQPNDHQRSGDTTFLQLSSQDNVLVLIRSLAQGETFWISGQPFQLDTHVTLGHKIAACDIETGEKIMKYGVPIGSAKVDIRQGEHVHLHNIQSDYIPTYTLDKEHSYVNQD